MAGTSVPPNISTRIFWDDFPNNFSPSDTCTHPLPNFSYLGFVELLNFAKPLNIEVVNCSYQGAVQLECDSRFMRSWLQTALQSGDVKQSVLSLDVFLYLHGIVQLLKQQPHGDGEKVATQKQRHPCEY